MSVQSVFIERIDGGTLHSKDGRQFQVGGAKFIDNTHKAAKPKQAEMFYRNGEIFAVILR
jgi:hypothetical protein